MPHNLRKRKDDSQSEDAHPIALSPTKKSKKASRLSATALRVELSARGIPFSVDLNKTQLRNLLPRDFRTPTKQAQQVIGETITEDTLPLQMTFLASSALSSTDSASALTRPLPSDPPAIVQDQSPTNTASASALTQDSALDSRQSPSVQAPSQPLSVEARVAAQELALESQQTLLGSMYAALQLLLKAIPPDPHLQPSVGKVYTPPHGPVSDRPPEQQSALLPQHALPAPATIHITLPTAAPPLVDLLSRLSEKPAPDISPIFCHWSAGGIPLHLQPLICLVTIPILQPGIILPLISDGRLLALFRVISLGPVLCELVQKISSEAECPHSGALISAPQLLALNEEGIARLGQISFVACAPRPSPSSSPPPTWSPPWAWAGDPSGGKGGGGDGGDKLFIPPSNYPQHFVNPFRLNNETDPPAPSHGFSQKQMQRETKLVGTQVSRSLVALVSKPGDNVLVQGASTIYYSVPLTGTQVCVFSVLSLASSCGPGGIPIFAFMPMDFELGVEALPYCQAFRDSLPVGGPVAVNFVGVHADRAVAAANLWIATLSTVFDVREEIALCWKALVLRWAAVLLTLPRSATIVSLMCDSLQSRLNDTLQPAMAGIFGLDRAKFIDVIDRINFSRDDDSPAGMILQRAILGENVILALAARSTVIPPISPATTPFRLPAPILLSATV